ncbi:MAG: DNA primase, partial [Planctomycetota bacterium]
MRQVNDRDNVLESTDIAGLIGEHLALRARGREYIGLCPFHDDHKPSMYVVPHKQIFHCFSCGAGGNAIDFVMKYHGMDFREALRFLADRAGIELTPWKGGGGTASEESAQESGVDRDALAQANAFALSFFRSVLRHAEHGRSARELIAKRGISDEMVETFQIGAAPDRWDGLAQTIQSKGLDAEPFVAAGLLKRRETAGGVYDAFRNRLIFPILDQGGRAIAFGGRRLNDEEEPKYLNSSENALFHKSKSLFGLRQGVRAMQGERTAIVTEGYTDVISC